MTNSEKQYLNTLVDFALDLGVYPSRHLAIAAASEHGKKQLCRKIVQKLENK